MLLLVPEVFTTRLSSSIHEVSRLTGLISLSTDGPISHPILLAEACPAKQKE